MAKISQPSHVIGARVPPATKAGFAALAARHHLNGSSLLAKMVNEVLKANSLVAQELNQQRSARPSIAGRFGMPNTFAEPWTSELGDAITLARREIEATREATADVVRRNLVSWETRSEVNDV